MLMTSPYEGECKVCKKPIKKGDRISWVRGIPGASHALCSDEKDELREKLAPSFAIDANIEAPCPAGLAYYPFQKGGIAFALHRLEPRGKNTKKGVLIGDAMGLGKTLQAIGVINCIPEVKTVLIVCPASLRMNWRSELQKWLVRPARVWMAKDKEEAAEGPQAELFVPEIIVHIVSSNMLAAMIAAGVDKGDKLTMSWDLVILDEAHIYKTWKSRRSTAARDVCRAAKRVIALTGTPVPNRVSELFPLLSMLDPLEWDPPGTIYRGKYDRVNVGAGEGAGMRAFGKRYCGASKICEEHRQDTSLCDPSCRRHWTYDGASNLDELQEILRTTLMVRRLKKDVLKELPPKVRQILKVPAEGMGGILQQERAAWKELGETPETMLDKGEAVPFEKMAEVRLELALAKVPLVLEEVQKILESGEKVIVMAHHRIVIEKLHQGLCEGGWGPVLYYGGMSDQDKDAAVRAFQTNPDVKAFVGGIMAAGVGLTLHASSRVVFAEESWRPLDVDQAEDRAHRIGQKGTVHVLHVCVDKSLDARMVELIVAKQEVADLALDFGLIDEAGKVAMSVEERRRMELAEMGATEQELTELLETLVYFATEEKFVPHWRDIGRELAKQKVLSPGQAKLAKRVLGR